MPNPVFLQIEPVARSLTAVARLPHRSTTILVVNNCATPHFVVASEAEQSPPPSTIALYMVEEGGNVLGNGELRQDGC